jgi:hypothetical protein
VCTCKAHVFLAVVGLLGVVEFENVKDSLRILLLFQLSDVRGLEQPSPLLRHALHTQTHSNKREMSAVVRELGHISILDYHPPLCLALSSSASLSLYSLAPFPLRSPPITDRQGERGIEGERDIEGG